MQPYHQRMDDLRARFGNLLAAHRKRAGLTQEQLAAVAEMSVDMIARIEAGKTGVRFPSIEKLSRALKIDPAALFTHEVEGRGGLYAAFCARVAKLSDDDLRWLSGVMDAAIKPR